MAGIGSIGGMPGANPLGGMAGMGGMQGGGNPLGGLGDMGLGEGSGSDGGGNLGGIMPAQGATESQGASFGDTLRSMVIERPSAAKADASMLTARIAAGDKSINPHTAMIASAKAGVEIQMATRTISSAVSAVRTLFQMQI